MIIYIPYTQMGKTEAYQSSYGGYYEFRKILSEQLWLWKLEDYYWFGWDKKLPSKRLCPLMHFVNHSDCEWHIKAWRKTRLKLYRELKKASEKMSDWFRKNCALKLSKACYDNYKEWWRLKYC